jgi:hypothetical protein
VLHLLCSGRLIQEQSVPGGDQAVDRREHYLLTL